MTDDADEGERGETEGPGRPPQALLEVVLRLRHQPGRAGQAAITAMPVTMKHGASRSNQPPASLRAVMSTSMPCSSAPYATPREKQAMAEPEMKAKSQTPRQRSVRQRNSKATPRQISAGSMAMTGA